MVQAQVKPCLDKLNSDVDIDVKYFAQEALTGKDVQHTAKISLDCVYGGIKRTHLNPEEAFPQFICSFCTFFLSQSKQFLKVPQTLHSFLSVTYCDCNLLCEKFAPDFKRYSFHFPLRPSFQVTVSCERNRSGLAG